MGGLFSSRAWYNALYYGRSRNKQPVFLETEDNDFLPALEKAMEPQNNYSTDAANIDIIKIQIVSKRISSEDILEIEAQLEYYEKVSLVYLLYDDAEVALQYLIQLQHGAEIAVLAEWFKITQNMASCNTKLLEALAIIQNYHILYQLGYTINEINQRFLPLNRNTSLEVNITKKKLYCLCEDLTNDQLYELLYHVKEDFKVKKIEFKCFSETYLEMHLIHWQTVKYISPNNFTNLAGVLKIIDKLDISDYLRSISETSILGSSRPRQTYLDDVPQTARLRSVSNASSVCTMENNNNNGHSYYMNDENPGICLIINQELFYTEHDPALAELLPNMNGGMLEDREGTQHDCNRIQATMRKFGFHVIVEDNLDHTSVLSTIKNVVSGIVEESSLFIFILSHGIQGKVYGNNSIPIEVKEIQRIINKTNIKNLWGKPKVLVIQACQGSECQEVPQFEDDIQMDGPIPRPTPRAADMLVFWATVPGYGAIRDKKKGTWFIQSLCDKLEEKAAGSHFEDVCTMVINDVINKRWKTKTMVPIKESTLSQSLYLPKLKCL